MARDPNALKYPESWVDIADDLKKLPPPSGVNKAEWDAKIASGNYYANVKVYQNGRRVVEWYQRGVGGGVGQPDPVQAMVEDTLPTVKAEWDKEETKAAEKEPDIRTINGVPHERGPDGVYRPVQTTTGTATSASASRTPEKAAQEQAEENERSWNADPNNPRGSGFRETHLERREREARETREAEARTRQAQQDARQREIDAQNAATRAAAERRAEAAEQRSAGAERRAEEQGAFGVEPAGAPEMTYTVGQMSAGLRQYSQWLSQQVKLHKDTNGAQGIAPNEATKLMERRIALAESTLKEQEGLANVQASQRGQDITQRGQTLSDTAGRRSAAQALHTNALSTFVPLATRLGPGGGALLSQAINDTLASGRGYVDSFGGLRESPEISADSFPALAELRRASMAGIQTAAQGGPRIFDIRTPPPSGADVEAANQAAQSGFREAIGPLLGPPPAAPAAAPAAAPIVPPANNPIDGTPIALPTQMPGAPARLPIRDDWSTDPGLTPLPPFVTPDRYQPAPPINLDPSQGPVGMQPPMRAIQEMRYGGGNYFDPDLAGNDLSMRLGIPPEIMSRAISGLYG